MNSLELLTKIYNSSNDFMVKVVSVIGINVIVTTIYGVNTIGHAENWLLLWLTMAICIPVGILFILIKVINRFLFAKFKLKGFNINFYLLYAILSTIIYTKVLGLNSNDIQFIVLYAILASIFLKTPFLSNCRLKVVQEKTEKVIVFVSFIVFAIMWVISITMLTIGILLCLFILL